MGLHIDYLCLVYVTDLWSRFFHQLTIKLDQLQAEEAKASSLIPDAEAITSHLKEATILKQQVQQHAREIDLCPHH